MMAGPAEWEFLRRIDARDSKNVMQTESWWIVFESAVHRGWWRLWTSPGFGHCWAFRMVHDQAVFAINPHLHRLETELTPVAAHDLIAQAKAAGSRIVFYKQHIRVYDPARDKLVGRGLVVNCATVLAYLMGIRFSWRCTPKALYRALLAAGATEV